MREPNQRLDLVRSTLAKALALRGEGPGMPKKKPDSEDR